jgi:hypothetical protein
MQLTEQHVTDRKDPRFAVIDAAAFASKNLYNAALYEIRKEACIMAQQNTVEVGNAFIIVAGNHDSFGDGHTTSYLEFYEERHRPSFPLTSQTIPNHLLAIFNEPSVPSLWKAGRITGWMEALMENSP